MVASWMVGAMSQQNQVATLLVLLVISAAAELHYYPRTKGFPWASKRTDTTGNTDQLFSIRDGLLV